MAKKTTKKAAKTTKKAATKKAATKKASGKKRKPNAAFMAPKKPSAQLAQIVGATPLPRTECTKKIWAYIKKNGLQEGRNIHADDKLKAVFGGKKTVTMFEMAALMSKHLS